MLIAEYILRERTENGTMPEKPALVETIVTTGHGKGDRKSIWCSFDRSADRIQIYLRTDQVVEEQNTYHYVRLEERAK